MVILEKVKCLRWLLAVVVDAGATTKQALNEKSEKILLTIKTTV